MARCLQESIQTGWDYFLGEDYSKDSISDSYFHSRDIEMMKRANTHHTMTLF